MKELSVFSYSDKPVRAISIDGEPWVVAKDVCDALEVGNPSQAISRLDEDEVILNEAIDSLGRTQLATFVNEAGLYSLILGSRKKEAKTFKRWITHEVIPAIRKTGSYGVKPMTQAEIIAAQAQCLVSMERKVVEVDNKVGAVEKRLDNALTALSAPTPDGWKRATGSEIRHFCSEKGLNYMMFWNDIYDELEKTAHVNIKSRQTRLKMRLRSGGAKFADCNAVSKLDVVDRDPKLRSIFEGIFRRKKAQAV